MEHKDEARAHSSASAMMSPREIPSHVTQNCKLMQTCVCILGRWSSCPFPISHFPFPFQGFPYSFFLSRSAQSAAAHSL